MPELLVLPFNAAGGVPTLGSLATATAYGTALLGCSGLIPNFDGEHLIGKASGDPAQKLQATEHRAFANEVIAQGRNYCTLGLALELGALLLGQFHFSLNLADYSLSMILISATSASVNPRVE